MATEFERIKQEVGGHSVTITSWYDEAVRCWHASAPAYSFLNTAHRDGMDGCPSRKAAIDRLVSELHSFFSAGASSL